MEPRLVIQDIPFVRRGPEEKEEICRVVSDGRNFFRLSAQAFIVDDQGRFYSFVMPNYNNRNFRQPVQGGLDAGETAVEAALRETKEEIGVDRDCLEFLSFIVPGGEVDITEENWKDAVNLGDSFRYDTRLRQIGLKSQQLVPVLFTVKSGATLHINFSEEEYPTFVAAKLCHLNDLATCAATCKKPVMAMIVEAAVETILALDARGRWNRPLDYVTGPAAPEVSLISRGRGRGRGRGMSERGGHRDANAAPLNTDDRGRGRGGRGGRGRGRGDRGRGGRGRGFVNDANRQQGYQANTFYGEREERTRRHENEMNQQAAHQQEMQYEHQT